MGNILTSISNAIRKGTSMSSSSSSSSSSSRTRSSASAHKRLSSSSSRSRSIMTGGTTDDGTNNNNKNKKATVKKKYSYIPDRFSSLEQVTVALREAGLESSNLIIGIDFTKSNEWTGKISFNNRSLHSIGNVPNPYETAISVVGRTLAPFDDDNLIPCYGFGDATTRDREVFSFHTDHSPCNGLEEVLACYKKIVPNLRLAGPTSYAPVVEAAIDIVEKSGGQFHILVIIADGQVTRSVDTDDAELSPQEKRTIDSIVSASIYPLSIVLVGVGDGPWEDMKKFDDKIPARDFDNFQFVNFSEIMAKNASQSAKETAFALAALMEIPFQYKAALELGLLGRSTGRGKKVVPRPPPVLNNPHGRGHGQGVGLGVPNQYSTTPLAVADDQSQSQSQVCPVCLANPKEMAFGCGHMTCRECEPRLSNCPICRQRIISRLRLYM